MMSHDYTTIDGKQILHSTARRDYICGDCGSRLITIFKDGEWQTVCADEESHHSFMKETEWFAVQSQMKVRAERGREVFAHLPPEIQELMKGE